MFYAFPVNELQPFNVFSAKVWNDLEVCTLFEIVLWWNVAPRFIGVEVVQWSNSLDGKATWTDDVAARSWSYYWVEFLVLAGCNVEQANAFSFMDRLISVPFMIPIPPSWWIKLLEWAQSFSSSMCLLPIQALRSVGWSTLNYVWLATVSVLIGSKKLPER